MGILPLLVEANICMVKPVDNPIVTSRFGKLRTAADVGAGYSTSVHQGLDFGGGSKIYATAKGVVHYAQFAGSGYGNVVIIKRTDAGHEGEYAASRHLKNSFPKAKGSTVNPGDVIGYMGGTGSSATTNSWAIHLHFDYMVPQSKAVQYEFDMRTGAIAKKFTHMGSKSNSEWRANNSYFTDPSPYFCETFKIKDNNAKWGADTKAQYQIIAGKLPNAGSPPSAADVEAAMSQTPVDGTEGTATAENVHEFLSDSDGYGALNVPTMFEYKDLSPLEMVITEADRRYGSVTWQTDITKVSSRALWVDYVRIKATENYLDKLIYDKKQSIEGLMATLTSLRLNNARTAVRDSSARATKNHITSTLR